jgi:hypothetical protein
MHIDAIAALDTNHSSAKPRRLKDKLKSLRALTKPPISLGE